MKFASIIVVLFITSILVAAESKIELVKTIGDERADYTFFDIYGAIISESGEIFVSDGKGHFLAKYDSKYNLKKRIGRKGKGPGDFYFPRCLNICDEKILVYDSGNIRIVKLDMDLNILDIFKLKVERRFSDNFIAVNEDSYLGDVSVLENPVGLVAILNKKGDLKKIIFDKFPLQAVPKNPGLESVKSYIKIKGMSRKSIAFDRERQKIFISFKRPDNPIKFFLYHANGQLESAFEYRLDNKYRFPYYSLKSNAKPPVNSFEFGVDSVFFYKEYFVVLLVQFEKRRGQITGGIYTLLILDKDGHLNHRQVLDKRFRFFYLSKKGYLLGKSFDEDIEKLYIFKLKTND